MEKLMIAAYI